MVNASVITFFLATAMELETNDEHLRKVITNCFKNKISTVSTLEKDYATSFAYILLFYLRLLLPLQLCIFLIFLIFAVKDKYCDFS